MVLCKGNNPEFIRAGLAAGKTYFVTVALKRGFAGPASCHLEPVRDARGSANKTDKWVAKLLSEATWKRLSPSTGAPCV